jgi:large repetitive protein
MSMRRIIGTAPQRPEAPTGLLAASLTRLLGALLSLTLVGMLAAPPAQAGIEVEVSGPGGRATQTLPDDGGAFDLKLPLTRNAVNSIRVRATDAAGNQAEQDISITQVSLDSVVVSRITSERLAPQQIEALVADGVIQLDDPANFNVSVFNIVLTIANRAVPVSVPIVTPIVEPELGFETIQMPNDPGAGGSSRIQDTEIIVFEKSVSVPGQAPISLPGVIVIEGRIKSLKEFFSVRLLLMNTSGIFTLSDVNASILFPTGGLSSMLPADGVAAFGAIPPGNVEQPGQKEREFVIRGDEIGVRPVSVEFGGFLTGPGIPIDEPIPFSGRAETDVDVRGPPTFDVQVVHPDAVVAGVPYELEVQITNTDSIPALYATLDLAVGFDAQLLRCEIDAVGEPVCTEITGADLRNLGHLLPGERTTQVFTVRPLRTGDISACMAAADQNLSLRVVVGTIGCLVGEFPPVRATSDGTPAVSVLPSANMTGVGVESPVVAFFSQPMRTGSISTGLAGAFNVYTSSGDLVPGAMRFDTLNDRTVAVWQPLAGALAGNTEFFVVITTDVVDADGFAMTDEWNSSFTTTGTGADDFTPPELTLSVVPPADPSQLIPGQVVRVNAYAADQGSGVVRVEARIKDLGVPDALYQLIDQRSVFAGDLPPFIFAIDSTNLIPGHDYQLLVTAYDGAGNAQDATLALLVAVSAAPPTLTLPATPAQPVPQGISVDVTPVAVSAGVRQVDWFLDGALTPIRTVTTAPFQASLGTLNLLPGPHSVRAVATDGLGQTGEAVFAFEVGANDTPPAIRFPGASNGQQVVAGESLIVGLEVEDGTGISETQVYLDDPALPQPLTIAGSSVRIDTSGLAPGSHRLVVLATNGIGFSNDPAAPGSYLEFVVVDPPVGAPPAAPVLDAPQPLADGQVRVSGQSVAGARITITNQTTGFATQVNADGSGAFSAVIDAAPGDQLTAVAFDLASSPNPSGATQATVPTPPQLVSISTTPASLSLTSVGALTDVTVSGQYDDGTSADLTAGAAFRSTATTIATVSAAGRVAAVGNGSAEIVVTVGAREARIPVTVNVVTLQSIAVTPTPIAFDFIGETRQLAVTGQYSDGSTQTLTGQASFSSADAAIATVNASGRVSAVGNGATQVYVAAGGLPPLAVPVTVDSAADTPPTIAILTPASGAEVEPGGTVGVTVRAQDAVGGVTGIQVTASGALTDSRSLAVSPAANDAVRSVSFTVPTDAPPGTVLRIDAVATDTSGQTSDPVTPNAAVELTVVDQTAPVVSITAPAAQTAYNFGDAIEVAVTASDAVGVAAIRIATSGGLTLADQVAIDPARTTTDASFTLTVPAGTPGTDLRLLAFASDAAGNEGAAIPVDVVLTGADITPPATAVTAVSDPGSGALVQVSYQVTDGLADLAHVELYFRRNGIGTFNRYTGPLGDGDGRFNPPTGANGTIAFDASRMGGDGVYAFATVGVDLAGNREALPTDDQGAVVGDPGALATFDTGAPVLLITSDTEIANANFDGQHLRVDGATLTLVGARSFGNVELVNGAVLTHRATTATETGALQVAAWTVTVDASSRIDVSARGLLGGIRAGLADQQAHTTGFAPGSAAGTGGSHGGLGARWSGASGQPTPVYGDLTNPTDLGAGGGGWSSWAGGNGGGRMLITAINLAVDGAVRADGERAAGSVAGGGAGGSVNLAARTLSGRGAIGADGGGISGNHTGGGGGRIAIRYLDLSTLNLAGVTAAGGPGFYGSGADGTVFLAEEGASNGELVINGQGPNSPFTDLLLPPGQTFDSITLQNGARVIASQPITVTGTLRLRGESTLLHPTGLEAGLAITANRVVVEAGSAIDVTGRGYLGGNRGGLGQVGETLNQQAGTPTGIGGSHGGLGGRYSGASGATGLVYGDPRQPTALGGGGGAWSSWLGGNGGGAVRIVAAEAVIVDGAIRADGGVASGSASGNGAGGSVWISTSRLAGVGTVSANGGGLVSDHTGAGGGRVAIVADFVDPTSNLGDLRQVSAWSGRGFYDRQGGGARSSAGTVVLTIGGVETLIIDDNETTQTAPTGTPLALLGPGVSGPVRLDGLTTDGVVPLLPGALIGQRLNPDLGQAETFRIVGNDADTVTVETPNGNGVAFAEVAAPGRTYALTHSFDNLTLRRGGHLEVGDPLIVSDRLAITDYGLLTHPPTSASYQAGLDVTADRLDLDQTARIDVTGRGYLGGNKVGGFGTFGQTLGFASGAGAGTGGSYGGLGGRYSNGQTNPAYGSLTEPLDLGSGGGALAALGGDGGGRMRIDAGQIANDGVIRADGGLPRGTADGAGSGGSVLIQARDLTGSGLITANGGGVTGNHTGGGGGRVAIRYNGVLGLASGNVRALGGPGYYGVGGHGTVVFQGPGAVYGDLVIDGLGTVQPADSVAIPGGLLFDNLTLQNGARAVADAEITVTGMLRLANDATLTHRPRNEAGLVIDAAQVVIEAGSAIDVSGRGYLGGNRSGLGSTGETLDGQPGSAGGIGGSHGGLGGRYAPATGATGLVYGDLRRPVALGAGGGAWAAVGGNGGGAVRIVASDAVIVDGAIRADGGLASGTADGNGAGGSVWIDTALLAGDGSISANGGGAGNYTGAGGGRIAIIAETTDPSSNLGDLRRVTAFSGRGYYDRFAGTSSSAGTVYLAIDGVETLVIDDNETTQTARSGTPLPLIGPGVATGVTADGLLIDGSVSLLSGALVGQRLNPDLHQSADPPETFAIIGNGADQIVVATPNEHGVAFADLAADGQTYGGDWRFDDLRLQGGGHLIVGDPLTVAGHLTITEYGLLTHPPTTTSYEPMLLLTGGAIEIDDTGRIDVSGRGHLGGGKTGLGDTAHTVGFAPGAEYRSGGSYGGLGGQATGYSPGQPNPTYGSEANPVDLGSGGGGSSGAGGDGGGRVFIAADLIDLAGAIRADGTRGIGALAGGGSGGSVNIRVGTLTGTGVIAADGGGIPSNHVGGGGGRIAIETIDGLTLPDTNIDARGGAGYSGNGGPGTRCINAVCTFGSP